MFQTELCAAKKISWIDRSSVAPLSVQAVPSTSEPELAVVRRLMQSWSKSASLARLERGWEVQLDRRVAVDDYRDVERRARAERAVRSESMPSMLPEKMLRQMHQVSGVSSATRSLRAPGGEVPPESSVRAPHAQPEGVRQKPWAKYP